MPTIGITPDRIAITEIAEIAEIAGIAGILDLASGESRQKLALRSRVFSLTNVGVLKRDHFLHHSL